jgi:hypothetical protein
MTFLVYAQDVEVSDFDMIAQGDSVASESDGSITVTDQGDYKVVEVYPKMPTSDDIITIPETDGGDRDKRFILRAFVTGRVSYISTSVLGDAGYEEGSYYDTASVIDGTKNDDFIWSDLPDFNFGDEVDVTNEQWLNGFIIDSAGGFVSTTSSAKVI